MKRLTCGLILLCGIGAAPTIVRAQAPGGPPPAAGRITATPFPTWDLAGFLLSHTAELQLTDQQVVRLAAVARRAGAERQALRARLDSLGPMTMRHRPQPGDTTRRLERNGPPPALIEAMKAARDRHHADVRDALSVLTPDQLATAWMMATSNAMHRGARPGWGAAHGRGVGVQRMRTRRPGPDHGRQMPSPPPSGEDLPE
ncbi:MAG: Spy/CpxP family protein refolding chaperone [Gemmatimonadaceae bacterium]|nr:Spy/CpxP family protein refolding chaperone [Gemmatimonadaceae bacterium]